MRVTIIQRFELALVFFVIRVLWIVDDIGYVFRKVFINSLRLGLYAIAVIVALSGFYVKSQNTGFYNIPSVLSPQGDFVLGVVSDRRPVLVGSEPLPNITAFSAYGVDVETGTVLFNLNGSSELAPASTTKLMTALVALDIYDLNDTLTVQKFCTEIEGLKAGFYAGDAYSVRDLLYSLLVNSSADAACTLATAAIPYNEFVDAMNFMAKKLGLDDTSFSNPVGLDGAQVSTAQNLYLLARAAIENDLIKDIVRTKEVEVVSSSGYRTVLRNTNDLLWTFEGSVGIKTGRTNEAGEVLIYQYDLDKKNIIVVTMRSADRFGDTVALVNWIFRNYSWPD